MKQTSFAGLEYAGKKRRTRREKFLAEMERLDLTNGMRLAPLANVPDDSRTTPIDGLAQARTSGRSVMAALPFTL